jgi:hypothetical protein
LNILDPITTPAPTRAWCPASAVVAAVISGMSAARAASMPSSASEKRSRAPTRSIRDTSSQLEPRLTSEPATNTNASRPSDTAIGSRPAQDASSGVRDDGSWGRCQRRSGSIDSPVQGTPTSLPSSPGHSLVWAQSCRRLVCSWLGQGVWARKYQRIWTPADGPTRITSELRAFPAEADSGRATANSSPRGGRSFVGMGGAHVVALIHVSRDGTGQSA